MKTITPLFVSLSIFMLPYAGVAAVSFEKQLWPVLQKKCVDCHAATKVVDGRKKEPKGGLRMDAAFALLAGGKDGPVLKPKNSAQSRLYQVVTLPKEDEDFMPPKGEAMTEAEVQLLKQWIDEGADFGSWEGNTEGKPAGAVSAAAAKREHVELYAQLQTGLKPVDEAILKSVKASGAQIMPVGPDSPLLRVDFLSKVSACGDEQVALLKPIAGHVAQLDLARSKITDAALAHVAQCPKLVRLDLRQTAVTDAGLKSLQSLSHLQSINLYGTAITDAGLEALAALPGLKNVYVSDTKVTAAGAQQAKAKNAQLKVVLK
jgi:hypothetical protein